jgi:hypothetical protein
MLEAVKSEAANTKALVILANAIWYMKEGCISPAVPHGINPVLYYSDRAAVQLLEALFVVAFWSQKR